jgi:small subunit ribosomal protein S16
MLMMRLQRVGRKNSPSYRILVVDSRQGVGSGKYIDQLGSYEPKSGVYEIDGEKAKHWLAHGVKASQTVHNMLVSKKIIAGSKITVQKPKKEEPKQEPATAPVAAPETEAAPAEATS